MPRAVTPRARLIIFLLLAIAIAGAVLLREYQTGAQGQPEDCKTLHTFADGSRLLLCPPLATAGPVTETPMPATTTPAPTRSVTPLSSVTPTPTPPGTVTPKPAAATITIAAPTPAPTAGAVTPTPAPLPTVIGEILPFQSAPPCPDNGAAHSTTVFHTLWDGVRACHYDHEHGQYPFTAAVRAALGGIDPYAFIGNVGVGHGNLSSPLENALKHGGFKWYVNLQLPQPCVGFESTQAGASAAVIQAHTFGDQAIENEARIHTAVAFVRLCREGDPGDVGYVAVVTHQEYGQRIIPYQGTVVGYPNPVDPAYLNTSGPYLSNDCVDPTETVIQCRQSLEQVISRRLNVSSAWASGPTGQGRHLATVNKLYRNLIRTRDGYKLFVWDDQSHPFTWWWVCSHDGGIEYDPASCNYNNSTTQVAEIEGRVPPEWDNLAGFDTDPRPGRVTADGFVTPTGELAPACTPRVECLPLKLINAFTGDWGAVIVFTEGKGDNILPINPERDIYFCAGQVCAETDAGAVSSGWIGPNN